MSCKAIEKEFKRLYKNKDYKNIGKLFLEATEHQRRCLEVAVLESIDIHSLRNDAVEILMHTSGKEKPPAYEILKKILNDMVAVYMTRTTNRGYKINLIVIRFRDGKQRALKSLKCLGRALEVFGVLKIVAIINKLKV